MFELLLKDLALVRNRITCVLDNRHVIILMNYKLDNYMNFKFDTMRHLILCSVMWLCGLMMAVGQNVPQVIPALQQWKSAKGKLVLPETGKVIVSSDEENELKGEAEILVQDLKEMFGWEYSVVVGKKEKGAVYLTLGKPDKTLGEEGYRMNIQGEVTIEAPTSKGVFGERVRCSR